MKMYDEGNVFDVSEPEVTFDQEAHWFPEGGEKTGGIEWSISAHLHGDDGKPYWIDCSVLSYPALDLLAGVIGPSDITMLNLRTESNRGEVVQSRKTMYKIAKFPNSDPLVFRYYPLGSLEVTRSDDQVTIELGVSKFTINSDKSWHFTMDDKETGVKVALVHRGDGYPMWYNDQPKDKATNEVLRRFTPNSIGGGYFWPGPVEGTITVDGKTVKVNGAGGRQRYYALNYSQEEVGGWHDWNWFHFDEMHGCVEQMKASNYKVMSLYMRDDDAYFPNGGFDIEHHDWALHPLLGALIPTRYKVTIDTDAGELVLTGDVVGSRVWASTKPPDCPFTMLDWENVEGTFTYKDGRTQTLTNGVAGNMIRQWRPYPSPYLPDAAELEM